MSSQTSRRALGALALPALLASTLVSGAVANADDSDTGSATTEGAAEPMIGADVDDLDPFDIEPDAPLADISIDYWTGRRGQSLGDIAVGSPADATSELAGGFDAPSNIDDNYGVRLRSVLTPTESGRYRFYAAGDDDVRLFFNKGGVEPAGASLAAFVAGWTDVHQWNRFASQRTVWFNLEAGDSYYVEMIGKEGSGSDHFSLGWQKKGDSAIEVVPADVLEATPLGQGGWRQNTPVGLPNAPATFVDPQFVSNTGVQTLDMSWAAVDGADFYEVSLEGAGEVRKLVVTEPALVIDNLVPSTRYLVEVAPGNAAAVQPPASTVVITQWGDYPTPVVPAADPDAAPSVVFDSWDTGWWTLTSIPDGTQPVATSTLSWGFEAPPMQGESRATRLRALVTPEVSGEYQLFLSGDDDARLLFNHRNHQAFRARTAAYVSGWTEQYQWDRHESQATKVYELEAGTSYYIEAIGVHAFGLDHLEVGWSLNGGEIEVIPAEVLSPTMIGDGGWRQSSASLPKRPARPEAVVVERTLTEVTAEWAAPPVSDTRGDATFYTVELWSGQQVVDFQIVDFQIVDSTVDMTVDPMIATFSGLDAGTRYRVKVRAWNAGGKGGARSNFVRPIRPERSLAPVFECVEYRPGGATIWFGYENSSTILGHPIEMRFDVGRRNRVLAAGSDALGDVQVPTEFAIGARARALGVEVDDGARIDRVRWRLDRSVAQADPSMECDPDVSTDPLDAS